MTKKRSDKKKDSCPALEFVVHPKTIRLEKKVSFCGKGVILLVCIAIIIFYVAAFVTNDNKDLSMTLVRLNSIPLLIALIYFIYGIMYYKKWQENRFVLLKKDSISDKGFQVKEDE